MIFLVVIYQKSTSQEPFIDPDNKVTDQGEMTLSAVVFMGFQTCRLDIITMR